MKGVGVGATGGCGVAAAGPEMNARNVAITARDRLSLPTRTPIRRNTPPFPSDTAYQRHGFVAKRKSTTNLLPSARPSINGIEDPRWGTAMVGLPRVSVAVLRDESRSFLGEAFWAMAGVGVVAAGV
jgi:hypothetical protein